MSALRFLCYSCSCSSISRSILQGVPAAITLAGISLVTTLFAPITEFFPMVFPVNIKAPPAIYTLSSM